MRQRVQPALRFGQSHEAQQLKHARAARRPIETRMHLQNFAHLLFNIVQRVQRGHGLLEHHAHAVAADGTHHIFRGVNNVRALELNAAFGVTRARIRQQAHDR